MENIKINNTDEKIIVSFTSWVKRIHLCTNVFKMMLNQTLVPDKIVLNLSIEEFPNKENDLPNDLIKIVNDNSDKCEIYWVEKNNRVWKKIIPTLNRYPNDVILGIDDDIEYSINYVENMYKEYLRWDGQCPIACFSNLNKNGTYRHSGAFSLVKKEFFNKYLDDLYENVVLQHPEINNWPSDEMYTYAAWLNGKRYKLTKLVDGKHLYLNSTENTKNNYSNYGHEFNLLVNKTRDLTEKYIKLKYNKTKDDLFKEEIIVNFTTWKKRHDFVPQMLETIKKQTLKPDKIVCWLSESEYEGVIPQVLIDCQTSGLINEINFVEGNTYCHKKWECMKKYHNCYNIMIDDDILYDEDFIEKLYNTSLENQNCAVIWISGSDEYIKNKRIRYSSDLKKNVKIHTFSGLSCYPPYVFPVESFKYKELRDKYCTRCDDSWIGAWLIKCDIEKVRVFDIVKNKERFWKCIDNSQTCGIWQTLNIHTTNGTQNVVKHFSNALIVINAVKEAKKIWPKFEIYDCCDKELQLNENIKTCESCDKELQLNENIIISLTSWQKRINNIPTVLTSILSQTKLPNKIVLNLSIEEFPNKESDIPENVIKFIHNNGIIEINWVDGKNTRQWKKFIPTMEKYPNDWIICIDDDRIYWDTFIEEMWDTHLNYPNNPITLNKNYRVNGYLQHCGHGTLETARFYNYFKNIDINELISKIETSDTVYNYLLHKNGNKLIPIKGVDKCKIFNENNALKNTSKTCDPITHKNTWKYLVEEYGEIDVNANNLNNKTITQNKLKKIHSPFDVINNSSMTTQPQVKTKVTIQENNNNELIKATQVEIVTPKVEVEKSKVDDIVVSKDNFYEEKTKPGINISTRNNPTKLHLDIKNKNVSITVKPFKGSKNNRVNNKQVVNFFRQI